MEINLFAEGGIVATLTFAIVAALKAKFGENATFKDLLPLVAIAVAIGLAIVADYALGLGKPIGQVVAMGFVEGMGATWFKEILKHPGKRITGNAEAVVVLAVGLSLASCAGAVNRSEAAFASAHQSYAVAQSVAIELRARQVIDDEAWAKIKDANDKIVAIDNSLIEAFKALELTSDAVRKKELENRILDLIPQYLRLANEVRETVEKFKKREVSIYGTGDSFSIERRSRSIQRDAAGDAEGDRENPFVDPRLFLRDPDRGKSRSLGARPLAYV